MQTYRPRAPSGIKTIEQAVEWMHSELQSIHKAANTGSDGLALNVLYVAPAKPQIGWHYVADGTSWNPGSGAGTYRYAGGGVFTLVG